MYTVRWQQLVPVLESGRYRQCISKIRAKTVDTLEGATSLAYSLYADSDCESHYAVISENGRYVRSIRFGSLDGFRR